MGNVVMRCCVGVTVVRILRPNGRIDDFDFPVTALEVMQRYPHHLVIQSNYIERDCSLEQQQRRVTIVRPDSKLLPGHEYILYPIPPHFRETVGQSIAKQFSWSNPDKEHHLKRKLSRLSEIIAATRHFATILQTARDSSKVGEAELCSGARVRVGSAGKPMEGLEGILNRENEETVKDHDEELDEAFSFSCSASWKPSLRTIPESALLPDSAHLRRHSLSSSIQPSSADFAQVRRHSFSSATQHSRATDII